MILFLGLAALLVTFVGPLAVVWLHGAVSESGRRWAARRDDQRRERRAERAKARAEQGAVRASRDVARAAEQRLEQLAAERVGFRFFRHYAADDSGMIGTVVRLGQQFPQTQVVVDFVSPPGRIPTPFDFEGLLTIDWRTIRESADDRRHRTARVILNSYDDTDGWVEFEPIGHSLSRST